MSDFGLRHRINRFIQSPTVEYALIGLILLSVGLVVAEVILEPQTRLARWIWQIQGILTGIFMVELTVRFAIAQKKRRFLGNYWIDILAVMPFVHAFRILRLLRLLRLLRAGILLNRNLNRLSSALAASIGAQIGAFVVIGLITLVGGLGIYLIEGQRDYRFDSLREAFWWSFLTLVAGEPIGGDPRSDGGRAIALIVMMGGLTTFAVFTGVVSAVMIQRLKTVMELKAVELDELRGHIVICGWNREGHLIVEELMAERLTNTAIAIVAEFTETPEKDLRHLNLSQLFFYSGDYTTLDVLENVGIYNASRAILLADNSRDRTDQDRDARTVLAALTIEKLNPSIYTCAQLLDRKNDVQLKIAGVDDIIVATEVTSHLIATSIRNHGLVDVLSELLTVQTGSQFYRLPLPSDWVGQPYFVISQQLLREFDSILIAVEPAVKTGERSQPMVNPPKDRPMAAGDSLIVIAARSPQPLIQKGNKL
ncbi:MAG: ion transporter [Cyanobacteria bacterium P01_H01_bin.119]